ncbi:MAG: shikimate dehydrogenase [archaeon]|nr:shikimate dehydrogenase [archaeon]
MRVCASYGSVPDAPADADMHEIRLDVFDTLPEYADENSVVTLAGKDISAVPAGFKGLVDIGESDAEIPFRKIRSVHDFEKTPSEAALREIMAHGDQELSKCACRVNTFSDLHTIHKVATTTERRHLILGMGELGTVTRIRQELLGNYFSFGYVGRKTAEGQLSAEEMMALGDDCRLVGIIGHPLGHSMSPQMQGAAMRDKGINGLYLRMDSPDLEHVEDVIREYDITGLNVTIPYKQDIIPHLDSVEGPAERMGAVNTIINRNGTLVGTNTDYAGVLHAFERAGRKLSECSRVLVFGSGGASRSAIYAAQESGCDVRVLGRTPEKVAAVCRDMGCEIAPEATLRGYDAVINCTSIGMNEDSPYMFDLADLDKDMAVMDMVYNRRTQLVQAAMDRGCVVASGRDMLVGQGAMSFEKWFGVRPDTEVMRKAIE